MLEIFQVIKFKMMIKMISDDSDDDTDDDNSSDDEDRMKFNKIFALAFLLSYVVYITYSVS